LEYEISRYRFTLVSTPIEFDNMTSFGLRVECLTASGIYITRKRDRGQSRRLMRIVLYQSAKDVTICNSLHLDE